MAQTNATSTRRGFARYGAYVATLQQLAREPRTAAAWDERTVAALDGQAGAELRRVISLKTRRKFGAFFTGSNLAARLVAHCSPFNAQSVLHDPSLGMGDLLLAGAQKLPLGWTLADTLRQWSRQLTGTDLHREFITGAKLRLVLLARQRHGLKAAPVNSVAGLFPGIRVADGLTQHAAFARATNLLLNPPFVIANAPADCRWAGGRITKAASFVVTALERARPGTELVAILPDVLRSGSFSAQWRKRVEELAEIQLAEPYGIFDDSADVDVFLLRVTRRVETQNPVPHAWTTAPPPRTTTVADFFDVHVGRVVPHRDKEAGPERRYIHPRNIDVWKEVTRISEKRRHEGLTYQPPFVVLRRTSRPGHPYRAAATVILGKKPVAVENHLIVCEPHDKSADTCRALMEQLRTQRVNDFLDQRIRCRHLTVGAVAAIPFNFANSSAHRR